MKKARPLQSLYASPLAGNVGAANREQEILTPDWLVGEVRAGLGGVIGLDPCASAIVENQCAVDNWCLDPMVKELERLAEDPDVSDELKKAIKAERKRMYLAGPGLTRAWTAPAYCNPPYEFLEPWLRMLREGTEPAIALVPVRPQRKWWCALLRGIPGQFLKPFPFKGCKSSFPAPLCLLHYRCERVLSSHATAEFCL